MGALAPGHEKTQKKGEDPPHTWVGRSLGQEVEALHRTAVRLRGALGGEDHHEVREGGGVEAMDG